jgi:mannose-6-phosphate isomerase-like protein (cupin superfamily)
MNNDAWTHKPIAEMETIWGGSYVRARGELEVTSFGFGIMQLPPNFDMMPAHAHTFDGQEEVYLPLAGSGEIVLGDEHVDIDSDTVVRVGPDVSRKLISGPDGLRVLVVGGVPGQPYSSFEPLEVGAPEPNPAELPGVKAAASLESSSDDWSVLQLSRMDELVYDNGVRKFHSAGKALGTGAFGISVIDFTSEAGDDAYPLHDHAKDGQTEVYLVESGSGTLVVDDERIEVGADEMVAVGPEVNRQWIPGDNGMRLIALGA